MWNTRWIVVIVYFGELKWSQNRPIRIKGATPPCARELPSGEWMVAKSWDSEGKDLAFPGFPQKEGDRKTKYMDLTI